jgi:hypothetical protein
VGEIQGRRPCRVGSDHVAVNKVVGRAGFQVAFIRINLHENGAAVRRDDGGIGRLSIIGCAGQKAEADACDIAGDDSRRRETLMRWPLEVAAGAIV